MADLFARKPLNRLMGEAQEIGEHTLKRSLGPTNLVMLAFGCPRVCSCRCGLRIRGTLLCRIRVHDSGRW